MNTTKTIGAILITIPLLFIAIVLIIAPIVGIFNGKYFEAFMVILLDMLLIGMILINH